MAASEPFEHGEPVLALVAQLAVVTIEGCDFAGVFLPSGASVQIPGPADGVVTALDALVGVAGEAPCLDAIAQECPVYAEDLADDPRWPRFGPPALGYGVRSLLSLPMVTGGRGGAFNLYSRYPRAFGAVDRARALLLTALATGALSSALTHDDQQRQAENLRAALVTREIIGQAQGILMERERLTAAQAFEILRHASQHLNRKLSEVAQDLVETGERPDIGTGVPTSTGPRPPRGPYC
ncbi:MAG: GAF and ANTAR domain-containing protein [Acidimicrobiales bacterium]